MSFILQQVNAPLTEDWSTAEEADALLIALQGCADGLLLPLARSCSAVCDARVWGELGYALQADYARERLGRDARWLRQMAALGRTVENCPCLGDAVTGEDGAAPIGLVKALQLARVATVETIEMWIERARAVGVRQLTAEVRTHLEQSRRGNGVAEMSVVEKTEEIDEEADPITCLSILMPREARAAYREARALHRAAHGSDASEKAFVESLIGDHYAGGGTQRKTSKPSWDPADVRLFASPKADDARSVREQAIEHALSPSGQDLRAVPALRREVAPTPGGMDTLRWARQLLDKSNDLFARAGSGTAEQLHDQIVSLIALEDELQKAIANLLYQMDEWRLFDRTDEYGLPHDSVGHYAVSRLGVSRSTACRRVRLFRRLDWHPRVARAYEEGRINTVVAELIVRALGRYHAGVDKEAAWLEYGERCTVRRLRDALSIVQEERDLRPFRAAPEPPVDESWLASLKRSPGDSFLQVVQLAARACEYGRNWARLRIYVPRSAATDFSCALDDACRLVGEEKKADRLRELAARRATFSADQIAALESSESLPYVQPWQGLMRMVLGFVATQDPQKETAKRKFSKIYERDGYRCTAPGCTLRDYLEAHHIKYRSGGGDDSAENLTTLCRTHHHRGEHGGLMSVRGKAPRELVFRIGRGRSARRYANDMLVPAQTSVLAPGLGG